MPMADRGWCWTDASINLAGTPTAQSWDWGQDIVVNDGTVTRTDGTLGSFADAALSYSQSHREIFNRHGGVSLTPLISEMS